jgi:putative ABC transport system permease protein
MVSTLVKKAWNDLSRRKARTVLTLLTVALAVGSMGLLFVSPMMETAMVRAAEDGRLHNIRYTLANASFDAADIEAFGNIDDVKGVAAHTVLRTKVRIGERNYDAILIGVDGFDRQQVDIISVAGGREPGPMEALSERYNAKYTPYPGGAGDNLTVLDISGQERTLNITGTGRSFQFWYYAQSTGIVLYATSGTVRALAGTAAVTFLELDLAKDGDADIRAVMGSVDARLNASQPGAVLRSTPEIVKDAHWPGRDGFNNMMMAFSAITMLALVTGIVLISNTMNTTILEQTREIGCLKAVGASGLQVAGVYLTMAGLIGLIGSVAGSLLGIAIANMMCRMLGPVFGISFGFGLFLPGVLIPVAAGSGLSALASLPALFRASRLSVRDALDEQRSTALGPAGLFGRLTFGGRLPRTVQMGARNIGRNRGRSAATVLQLALAVATLLSMSAIAASVQDAISDEFRNFGYDIEVTAPAGPGRMDPADAVIAAGVAGVERVEPFAQTYLKVGGQAVHALGLPGGGRTYRVPVAQGRWFSEAEAAGSDHVIVMTTTMSRLAGISPGDHLSVKTPAGMQEFLVVGLAESIQEFGHVAYMPLPTMQSFLGFGTDVGGFYVTMKSKDHGKIDSAATQIEKAFLGKGKLVQGNALYIVERQGAASVMGMLTMLRGLGFIIVLISMVGLANNLTMTVLERTREIGVLRCIGGSERNIRAVFSSEGLALMLAGWGMGIPLGLAVGWGLFQKFIGAMALQMPFQFPAGNLLVALAVVVGIGLLVIQVPITRAVRIPPGAALRYQ